MKNLFGMARKSLKGVFLTMATLVVLFWAGSCQHDTPQNNPTPATDKVTITVEKDAHITSVTPSTYQVKKGAELGRADLKDMFSYECENDYELSKICLNTATGEEITDSKKHKFDANTTIYFVSREKSSTPELKSLIVNGVKIKEIKDAMNAGSTPNAKVLVEYDYSPSDAQVTCTPSLDGDKNWALNDGENTLTIKVKKGSQEKTYTVTIKKLDADTPLLLTLTVAGQKMEGGQIDPEKKLAFAVPDKATEVPVMATVTDGATIEFEPALTGDKLALDATNHATELKVIVKKENKKTEYTVLAKKTLQAMLIYAGTQLGVRSEPSKEDMAKIFNHENVNVTLAGNVVTMITGTTKMGWKSVKVNGIPIAEIFPYLKFNSVCVLTVPLADKGSVTDVKIEIESAEIDKSSKKIDPSDDAPVYEEFNFKITRQAGDEGKIDVVADQLLVGGQKMIARLPDDLKALCDGSRPVYQTGSPANVEVQFKQEVKSVTIDGQDATLQHKKDQRGNDLWYAQGKVTVPSGGKDVDIVMTPKDDETDTYNVTTWKFKLEYEEPEAVSVSYEINDVPKSKLPKAFTQALDKGQKGSITVKGKALNLRLISYGELDSIKINDNITINANEIETIPATFYTPVSYVGAKTVTLQASGKTDVKIEFNPKDTGKFSKAVLNFEAQGDNTEETISPVFVKINNDKELPKENFIDKLADNSVPAYSVYGSKAEMEITMSEYEGKFLCQEVKVDDGKVELEKVKGFGSITYKLTTSVDVHNSGEKSVKIEFVGKTNVAKTTTWNFKLKGDGQKPKISKTDMKIFKINEYGSGGLPLNKDFLDKLTNESKKPVFKFYGKKAEVTVGTYEDNLMKNAEFKFDSVSKQTVEATKQGYIMAAKYEYTVADTNEHEIEIIVNPKDEDKYVPLKYTFKIQAIDLRESPVYLFGIDGKLYANGYTATLNAESAEFLVQTTADVMAKVEIGESSSLTDCTITSFPTQKGKAYQAKKVVKLDTSSSKTFVIKVTPKDTGKYATVECKYELKGTSILNTNAEFVLDSQNKPVVTGEIKWKTGLESNQYLDDYGAEKLTITARTVSPRAKVKWQFVNPIDDSKVGNSEGELTNSEGNHTGEITLLTDKATKLKLWVVAENNTTTDQDKGEWTMTYNQVPLFWDHRHDAKLAQFKTQAYDTIEIDKTKVKDGKISILIVPWKEADGYVVDNTGLPDGQEAFVKLAPVGRFQEAYKSIINVSKLLEATPSATEVNALVKMKLNDIECINYQIKIKLKS